MAILLLSGCGGGDFSPKPSAYLRIDMPEHEYWLIDTIWKPKTPYQLNDSVTVLSYGQPYLSFPFVFEANTRIELSEKKSTPDETWVDLIYPEWDGVVFLTYKRLYGPDDLRGQTDTSTRLLESHYQFTSGVEEHEYSNPETNVYAITYHLKGRNVASTYQFWATDRERTFLRGAVYLNKAPNNDSLAPVLEYIQQDVDHLIETLRWR